ncbi:MAG: zf-HC2 domain-containing protein [Anaerolineaceae bacterium]|nr:zf-HC2 domain-containing protein [Anaerolineaceae bacterium]
MNGNLSSHDWQLLSEYLDGELSPRDRQALEQRLQQQAELRAGLEELRTTRDALRSVPMRRVPRNFTLTPEMVQVRRPVLPGLFNVLRLSSAAAAVLVILTFVWQALPGTPVSTFSAPASQVAMSEAMQDSAASSPTPEIVFWAPANGMGGGGGGPEIMAQSAPEETAGKAAPETYSGDQPLPTVDAMLLPEEAEQSPQDELEAPEMAPQATQALESAAGAAPLPELSPTPAPQSIQPEEPARALPPAGDANDLILGIAPEQEQGQLQATPVSPALQPRGRQLVFNLVPLQILLAVIAVGCAAGAYFLWHKNRP